MPNKQGSEVALYGQMYTLSCHFDLRFRENIAVVCRVGWIVLNNMNLQQNSIKYQHWPNNC